jgi:hypothetical protein
MSIIGTIVSYQMSDFIGTPIPRLDSQQVTTSFHHAILIDITGRHVTARSYTSRERLQRRLILSALKADGCLLATTKYDKPHTLITAR